MKHITAIGLLLALGCGAVDDNAIDPTDDSGELGSLEEAINVGSGSGAIGGGVGFGNTVSHFACTTPNGPAAQVCRIPAITGATVHYCFSAAGSGFTATEKQDLRNGVENVDSQTTWNFDETSTVPCELTFISNAHLNLTNETVIETFADYIVGGTITALSSPAGASHINGSWSSYTRADVHVDTGHINVFNPPEARGFLRNQVGGHAATLAIGLGTTTSSDHNISYTRRLVNGSIGPAGLTTGDACRANGYGLGVINQIAKTFNCGI